MRITQSNLIAKILQKTITQVSSSISNSTYGAGWADDTTTAPSKAAVYAKIQTVGGGSFAGTMDDIDDGDTYVKTENNYTDEDKTKLDGLSGGLTQPQIMARSLGC